MSHLIETGAVCYDVDAHQILVTLQPDDCLGSEHGLEDLVVYTHQLLRPLQQSGAILFYDLYRKRLENVWRHLATHRQLSARTIVLGAGCPKLSGVRLSDSFKHESRKRLVITSAPDAAAQWNLSWLQQTVAKLMRDHGALYEANPAQIHACWLEACAGQFPAEGVDLVELPRFAAQNSEKGWRLLAYGELAHVDLLVVNPTCFSNVTELADRALLECQQLVRSKGWRWAEEMIPIEKETLILELNRACMGHESLGFELPFVSLLSHRTPKRASTFFHAPGVQKSLQQAKVALGSCAPENREFISVLATLNNESFGDFSESLQKMVERTWKAHARKITGSGTAGGKGEDTSVAANSPLEAAEAYTLNIQLFPFSKRPTEPFYLQNTWEKHASKLQQAWLSAALRELVQLTPGVTTVAQWAEHLAFPVDRTLVHKGLEGLARAGMIQKAPDNSGWVTTKAQITTASEVNGESVVRFYEDVLLLGEMFCQEPQENLPEQCLLVVLPLQLSRKEFEELSQDLEKESRKMLELEKKNSGDETAKIFQLCFQLFPMKAH